jgi:hypothetical protein
MVSGTGRVHRKSGIGAACASARFIISTASRSDLEALRSFELSLQRSTGSITRDRYLPAIDSSSSRYLLFRNSRDQIAASALLQGLDDPDSTAELERLVVADEADLPALLRKLLEWVFGETDTNRIEVQVSICDQRKKASFEAAGFLSEGILRESRRQTDGTFASIWLMTVLRREWSTDSTSSRSGAPEIAQLRQTRRGGVL